MGTLLHSCIRVHEATELPFRVMSGVGPSIGELDGGSHPPGKWRFWEFFVHWFELRFD